MASRFYIKTRKLFLPSTLIAIFLVLVALTSGPSPSLVRDDSKNVIPVDHLQGQKSPIDALFEYSKRQAGTPPPVDPYSYQGRVNKGMFLFCLMNALTDAEAVAQNKDEPVASIYTNFDQLRQWGWEELQARPGSEPDYGTTLDDVFKDLGIDQGENNNVEYRNNFDFLGTNGQMQRPTEATYDNLYNAYDGVIIADVNTSPQYAKRNLAVEAYPSLGQWSDVVALGWQQWVGGPTGPALNFIFRVHIANGDTQQQIISAFRDVELLSVPVWPGITFTPFDPNPKPFFAILGSKNGAGCGYLLAQHKFIFGAKSISQVTVWTDAGWDLNADQNSFIPSLVFTVENSPATAPD